MNSFLNNDVGSKIKFTGEGGYDGENKDANKELEVGKVYTVKHMDVGRSHSSVQIQENDKFYNTVMFETEKAVGDRDWFGESYPCFARKEAE